MKIGLCLSGGGVRATVFHLGVLDRLATQGLLEKVHSLSTVSGGSLAAGLVFSVSDLTWPGSEIYRSQVLPAARELLTSHDLQHAYLRRRLQPWRLAHGRASLLASAIEKYWGLKSDLRDLPARPQWLINATTYETGKNWRFERRRMGDYKIGYVDLQKYAFPISSAIAASAAVPGLIGPLLLRGRDFEWYKRNWDTNENFSVPPPKRVCLWDGGVYENLGIEPLYKPDKGYRSGVDFLLVSDASAPLSENPPRYKAPYRLVEVAMNQVNGLRSRVIINHFDTNPGTGSLLRLGNTAEYIFRTAKVKPPAHWDPGAAMSTETVDWARNFGTTLHRLSEDDFWKLFLHGYEIADITLTAYCGETFNHIPYALPTPGWMERLAA